MVCLNILLSSANKTPVLFILTPFSLLNELRKAAILILAPLERTFLSQKDWQHIVEGKAPCKNNITNLAPKG